MGPSCEEIKIFFEEVGIGLMARGDKKAYSLTCKKDSPSPSRGEMGPALREASPDSLLQAIFNNVLK